MKSLKENISHGSADCPLGYYYLTCDCQGKLVTSIHWHPEFEILYVNAGKILVRVEGEEYILTKGDIFFVHPNELHKVNNYQPVSNHHAFVFSLDFLAPLPPHFFTNNYINPIRTGALQFPRVLSPDNPIYPSIAAALNKIINCKKNEPEYKLTVFTSFIEIFTKMIPLLSVNDKHNKNFKKGNEIIKECILYLENNCKNKITLEMLSRHVHLHPNYLCKLFKKYTGQTIFQQLTQLRIAKAAELLNETSMPVGIIAGECGFENIGFFTRKFKKLMNTTPTSYRKQKNL